MKRRPAGVISRTLRCSSGARAKPFPTNASTDLTSCPRQATGLRASWRRSSCCAAVRSMACLLVGPMLHATAEMLNDLRVAPLAPFTAQPACVRRSVSWQADEFDVRVGTPITTHNVLYVVGPAGAVRICDVPPTRMPKAFMAWRSAASPGNTPCGFHRCGRSRAPSCLGMRRGSRRTPPRPPWRRNRGRCSPEPGPGPRRSRP